MADLEKEKNINSTPDINAPVFLDTTGGSLSDSPAKVVVPQSAMLSIASDHFGVAEVNIKSSQSCISPWKFTSAACAALVLGMLFMYLVLSFFRPNHSGSSDAAKDSLATRFLASGAELTIVNDDGKDLKVTKAAEAPDPLLITGVSFGTNADTSVLEEIYQLRSLRNLTISNVEISQSNLVSYLKQASASVTSLQLSQLPDIDVNDELIEVIRTSFPALKTLSIKGLTVSEGSIAGIAKMPYLQILNLADTNLTDAELYALKNMKLASLDVSMTKVTAHGLIQMRPYVKTLSLASLDINDEDIKLIANYFQILQKLNIAASNVSDDSVPLIQNMAQLTSLNIKETKISSFGIIKIQQSLPGCKITK